MYKYNIPASTKFNILIDEFMNKMMNTFPDKRNKLGYYYMKFKTAKLLNPLKPACTITEPLIPYGRHILQRNEDFFKKDEYIEVVRELWGTDIIDQWDDINPIVKESIWEYFGSIYVLGMLTLGLNDELKISYEKKELN